MRYRTTEKTIKLKGFLPLFRVEVRFLKEGIFKLNDFGAYTTLLQLTPWDRRNEKYGIVPSDAELEDATGIYRTTWYRYKRTISKKGLLQQLPDGRFRIINFWKYDIKNAVKLASYDVATLQELSAILQQVSATLQQDRADLQQRPTDKASGYVSESTEESINSNDKIADLQQRVSRKETIKNNKERIEKELDASHLHSHKLVPPYKNKYQESIEAPDTDVSTTPEVKSTDTRCSQCGKELTQVVIDYTLQKYGLVLCFNCSRGRRPL